MGAVELRGREDAIRGWQLGKLVEATMILWKREVQENYGEGEIYEQTAAVEPTTAGLFGWNCGSFEDMEFTLGFNVTRVPPFPIDTTLFDC